MKKNIVILEDDSSALEYADYLRETNIEDNIYICKDLTDADYRLNEEPGIRHIDRLLVDMNIGYVNERIPDVLGGWKWLNNLLEKYPEYPRNRIALVTMFLDKLDVTSKVYIKKEGISIIDKADDEIMSIIKSFCE